MIDLSRDDWRQSLDTEISRLEALLADLRRLRFGGYPSDEDLAAAVTMLNPIKMMMPVPVYAGLAIGHPERGSKPVRTSMVEIAGDGWFRSSNRLYRIEMVGGMA